MNKEKNIYTTHKQARWLYPLSVNKQMKSPSTKTKSAINLTRPPGALDNRREINEQATYNIYPHYSDC